MICLRQRLTSPPLVTPGRGIVAIGKPDPSMSAVVLTADDRPVRDGEPGQLALSGPQLALGSLNATADQASRFREIDGRRWYLTGDLAMRDVEGVLHNLGRTDNQVKVKGNRIELEEVKAHLRRAAASDVVAIVAWPVVDGSAQGLVGFCVSRSPPPQSRRRPSRHCRQYHEPLGKVRHEHDRLPSLWRAASAFRQERSLDLPSNTPRSARRAKISK